MRDLDQLELFDTSIFGLRPARNSRRLFRHRIYFAIRPPTGQAMAIHDLARTLSGPKRHLTPATNLHVSTNGIGQFDSIPDDILSRATAAGCAVRGTCFDVVFDRIQAFRSARQGPIVLRCAEGAGDIAELRKAIAEALRQEGLPAAHQSITPHLTLWYDETTIPEQVLASPFRWRVEEFFLVHSATAQPHRLPGHWRLAS